MGDWTTVVLVAMGKEKIHEYETCLGGKNNRTWRLTRRGLMKKEESRIILSYSDLSNWVKAVSLFKMEILEESLG